MKLLELKYIMTSARNVAAVAKGMVELKFVQLTSSRVRLGQSFKTVGCGCTSCWGDLGAGSVEAET